MTVEEIYQQRASVRKFKSEPLLEGDLEKILYAAQRAPTDAGAQLYSVLRISDLELRKEIVSLCGSQEHILSCAEFFVILADVHRTQQLVEHRGGDFARWKSTAVHFGIIDAVLSGSALETQARGLGYGTVWIGAVLNHPKEMSTLLKLPQGVMLVAGLCVGVADEEPKPRPRLAREIVIHENTYQSANEAQLEQAFTDMQSATRSGDWNNILKKYFATGALMEQREIFYQEMLSAQGLATDSLEKLILEAFAWGARSVQFHEKGHVWIEREPNVFRGEGAPSESILQALEAWNSSID